MTSVRFEHLTKTFAGGAVAVDHINLRIDPGELFFLLGPSGCGKSTLLRLVAGLHEPTAGRIFFNDRDVTSLPTSERNAVMVFQSYALWPHMTVRENVRFGLAVRKMDRHEQQRRVEEVLELVRLREYADRRPNQLSGGQQQRVALARALAVDPACLLLDEPLSNLDAKLRHEMRGEIRRICKEGGFTTIYVTHDQKEALSVADRIALLNAGKLVQVGTPSQLYHEPATTFVADFIGHTNLIRGKVIDRTNGILRVETTVGSILAKARSEVSGEVLLSIRPEQMELVSPQDERGEERNRITGRVVETTFLGEASEHILDVSAQLLRVIAAPPRFELPEHVTVEFDPQDVVVLAE